MSTSTIPNHVLGGWGKKVHHRHRDPRHCSVSHHSPPTTYTTEAHAAHNHLVTDRPPRAATAEGGGVTARLAESRAHRTVASSTLAWLVIGNFSTGSGNFSGPSAQGGDRRHHQPCVIACLRDRHAVLAVHTSVWCWLYLARSIELVLRRDTRAFLDGARSMNRLLPPSFVAFGHSPQHHCARLNAVRVTEKSCRRIPMKLGI